MTTSTNKTVIEGSMKGGIAKATSATLAGVLAVGMVPAAAFAADAVDEGDSIAPLTATDVEAFNGGYVSAIASTATGWTLKTDAGSFSSTATAAPTANPIEMKLSLADLTITLANGVQLSGSGASPVLTDDNFQIQYFAADANGKPTGAALSAINATGNFCVVINGIDGIYKGASLTMPVTVKSIAIPSGINTFPVKTDGTADYEATPNTFTFTGNPVKIALGVQKQGSSPAEYIALDNFVEGVDYTIKVIPQGSSVDAAGLASVVNAGKYSAVISGLGVYAGSTSTVVDFEIGQFDLVGATVTSKTIVASNALPTINDIISIVNGNAVLNNDQVRIDASKLTGTNAAGEQVLVFGDPGEYTFQVKPTKDNENVKGVADMTVVKVAGEAKFAYADEKTALPQTVDIDLSAPAASRAKFVPTDVQVYDGTEKLAAPTDLTTPANTDNYTIQVSTDGGKTFSNLTADQAAGTWAAGKYVVKVVVNPGNLTEKYSVGGERLVNVNVSAGTINATANATFEYNGQAFTQLKLPYNGTVGYAVNAITTNVADKSGKPVDAADYKVEITDADGKTFTSANMVNVGTYTFTLTSEKYNVTGNNTVTVTIEKANLADLKFKTDGTNIKSVNGNVYLDTSAGPIAADKVTDAIQTIYEVTPPTTPVSYQLLKDMTNLASQVTVTLQKQNDKGEWVAVSEIEQGDAGKTYRVLVAPANKTIVDNATFGTDEGTILTIGTSNGTWMFDDVAPTMWYFKPIAEATQGVAATVNNPGFGKFMYGYANTKLFGPNDKMTRAQVACILYNMAVTDDKFAVDEVLDSIYGDNAPAYPSFDDVDTREYYAMPIAWAKATGVVNGFGDGNFGPDQPVTREQFVCMLWNYAKEIGSTTVQGIDVEKALASKPDGAKVSDWAKDGVAWGVQNEIIGNGGVIDPLSTMTRAFAAAMGTNFLAKNNG